LEEVPVIRRGFVIVLAAGLLAVPAWAKPKVSADSTPGANFGAYQTFAFVNAQPPAGMNPVAFERIRQGVERGMAGKGYSKAETGDLSVIITVGARDKTDVQTWGRFGRQVDVYQFTEGQLSVDVFDTKTRQPLWHGQATETIDPQKPNPQKVEAAVTAVMAKFPARAAGN
jgi:hypothetical protein